MTVKNSWAKLVPFAVQQSQIEVRARANFLDAGNKSLSNILVVEFQCLGSKEELSKINFDPSSTQAVDLWQHTCFEFFIPKINSSEYFELNASASLHWNLYHLESYRKKLTPVQLQPEFNPTIFWDSAAYLMRVQIDVASFTKKNNLADRIGITMVMEGKDGQKTYWALHHAGAQPDFHLSESFQYSLSGLPMPSADEGNL